MWRSSSAAIWARAASSWWADPAKYLFALPCSGPPRHLRITAQPEREAVCSGSQAWCRRRSAGIFCMRLVQPAGFAGRGHDCRGEALHRRAEQDEYGFWWNRGARRETIRQSPKGKPRRKARGEVMKLIEKSNLIRRPEFAECDSYDAAAVRSVSMSSFVIDRIAAITRSAAGPDISAGSISGTICQERPNRSLSQPHWPGIPPSPSAFQ